MAPTPATPDALSIMVEKAEISSNDLTFDSIYDNPGNPVDLISSIPPISQSQIPVGTYRVLHLKVVNIGWHATWSPANPSPCDMSTSGQDSGAVDLNGHTDFYFKTPDLAGRTSAYYQANPPALPAYVGDANHPFVLVSPITVSKDPQVTTIVLTIGADHTLNCDSVGIYDRLAIGNALPSRSISGPTTQMDGLEGVYLDSINDEIGVINNGNNSLEVFHRTDAGNVSPLRTLMGPDTRFNDPEGVASYHNPTDSTLDELIVANQGNDSLTAFSRSASGNLTPSRTIVGLQTGLHQPAGIALYPDPGGNVLRDEMVVANQGNDSLTVYDRLFSENTAPLRTIVGPATGLSNPCGLYVDGNNDEIGVANYGDDSVTIYDRLADAETPPKRLISGPSTGLSFPCGIYLDSQNNEIGVANSGNDSVTIYNRTDTGNVSPKRTITGLNNPRALFFDSTHGEIGVVQQGPQVSMALVPPIFLSSTNQIVSDSVLSGDYNVVLYGADIPGVNGHGIPVPVVFAEQGKVTFDPTASPWPAFNLQLSTQLRRQIIEPSCPTEPNFTAKKSGFYGVNDDGTFYAFLPGIRGTIQGAFLPDGNAFVGSMVDSSNRLMVVYGLRSTSSLIPHLTSDGTLSGSATTYSFSSYRNDLFFINRFNNPPADDILAYRLADGTAFTDKSNFSLVNSNLNFLIVLSPMGDFAAPSSPGPNYNPFGETTSRPQSYLSSQGGVLNSLLYNLVGALSSDGGTMIFMRNTGNMDSYNCPSDIGFGAGLRNSPISTFSAKSLKGTYYMAGFGDQYNPSTQSSSHFSKAATLTFDGVGKVAVRFIHNEMGVLSFSQVEFSYNVGSKNIVNIIDRPSSGPFATAEIGNQGHVLLFHQILNPVQFIVNGLPNPTRLLGLALYQHP